VPDPQEQTGAAEATCEFEECACTGRNVGKFTSPAALLAIAETGERSGYDIAERLRTMALGGETGPDSGGLYRTLRRMERMNLVTSEWDTEGGGPARRLYRLTNLGDRCLTRWAETLRDHTRAIEGFLKDYAVLRAEAAAGAAGDPSAAGGAARRKTDTPA
jgi:poly-beta-hydroxybutyrate-responsive repressor